MNEKQPKSPSLLNIMKEDITTAKEGKPLQHTTRDWLQLLELDGDTPDGKTFLLRFTPGKSFLGRAKFLLRDVGPVVNEMYMLLGRLATEDVKPQEEELAKIFAEITSRQLLREGNICPTVEDIATMTYLLRPDYFPAEVQDEIYNITLNKVIEIKKEEQIRSSR